MFADPVKNLKAFGLGETDVVIDLGAGTGFYSLAAGKIVTSGKVYAVEIEKEYLTTIKNKAKDEHLQNIECLWGNVEKIGGTKIGDGVADAVIASNILFQVEDKDKFVEEIKRISKVGSRVLFIDWVPSSPFAQSLGLKNIVNPDKARELFEGKGFKYDRNIDAGTNHYGMIFKKL